MSGFEYVSLFSGIGGFEQALNKLGGECVFASEIDKFASQAYEALYGHKPAGDITQIDAKDIPEHDLLVGGFPCQAFSVAGKREGFDDTRGTLFFDIARIASDKQPKYLLLENVKGLVNHDKGNTLDTMIRTINDIGYIVDFEVLNSKYFGVPQNRERIFIVAIRKDLIESEPFSEESMTGQTVVPKGKRRVGEWADVFNFDWSEQEEVTSRLRDILEPEVDEKYYLSDEKTASLVMQLTDESLSQKDIFMVDDQGRTKKRLNPLEISPTLRRETHGNLPRIVYPSEYRIRNITPIECWRLQGFPDEAHEAVKKAGISDSQRYKQAGNAVTVNVVEAIAERLIPMLTGI